MKIAENDVAYAFRKENIGTSHSLVARITNKSDRDLSVRVNFRPPAAVMTILPSMPCGSGETTRWRKTRSAEL